MPKVREAEQAQRPREQQVRRPADDPTLSVWEEQPRGPVARGMAGE